MKTTTTKNGPAGIRLLKPLAGILIGGVLLGFTGCASTHQARSVTESGFLKDYSLLQEGKGDQAKLLYVNPAANWALYSKIYLEPVQLWHAADPKSKLGQLSREDQEMLVSFFYTELQKGLSQSFEMVAQPGPGVLVVRAALTEASQSKPVANLVSSVVPMGVAVSAGKRVVFGTGLGVGEAQAEVELLDGQTGQCLGAAVDRRAGTKALRTKFNGSFGDVKLALQYWSERLAYKLTQLRHNPADPTDL